MASCHSENKKNSSERLKLMRSMQQHSSVFHFTPLRWRTLFTLLLQALQVDKLFYNQKKRERKIKENQYLYLCHIIIRKSWDQKSESDGYRASAALLGVNVLLVNWAFLRVGLLLGRGCVFVIGLVAVEGTWASSGPHLLLKPSQKPCLASAHWAGTRPVGCSQTCHLYILILRHTHWCEERETNSQQRGVKQMDTHNNVQSLSANQSMNCLTNMSVVFYQAHKYTHKTWTRTHSGARKTQSTDPIKWAPNQPWDQRDTLSGCCV